MTLDGPAALDIVQHFIERWNEIKKRKVSFRMTHYVLLTT
jgi:phospholipase D1/2